MASRTSGAIGWLAIGLTQPIVWAALGFAFVVELPFTLYFRCRRQHKEIDGKHCVITGGSEGVGLELAMLCARRGARVSLVARTKSKLEAARAGIISELPNASVTIAIADVGMVDEVKAAVAQCEAASGPVDVCIAAAGAAIPKYFDELTADDFSKMLSVNYMGVVHCAQAVLPGMVQRGCGQFAAVSSMVAAAPFVGYAAYGPAKAACRCVVDTLRNEYADVDGISFHIAFPPDTDTPGLSRENETKPWETSHVWPEMFNETFAPQDVARLALDDMREGRYLLRSPDLFGNWIVSRSWGHHPRASPLFEAAIAPLFVGVQGVMCWLADRAVRRGARHSKAPPSIPYPAGAGV